MQFTGLILYVQNMKIQTAFYRDVLGVAPVEEQPFDPKGFFMFGEQQQSTLALHRGTKPNGGRAKLTFYVDDIIETADRLKAAKVRISKVDPPGENGGGNFNLKDPEGNRIMVLGRFR